MKTRYIKWSIVLLSLLAIFSFSGSGQNLTLDITGLKDRQGALILTIYTNRESYKKELPDTFMTVKKKEICNGIISLSCLTPGKYAIAVIDDVNENGRLDYTLFIPCEGFGFSNFEFRRRRKPDFESFAFDYTGDSLRVAIPIFYF